MGIAQHLEISRWLPFSSCLQVLMLLQKPNQSCNHVGPFHLLEALDYEGHLHPMHHEQWPANLGQYCPRKTSQKKLPLCLQGVWGPQMCRIVQFPSSWMDFQQQSWRTHCHPILFPNCFDQSSIYMRKRCLESFSIDNRLSTTAT